MVRNRNWAKVINIPDSGCDFVNSSRENTFEQHPPIIKVTTNSHSRAKIMGNDFATCGGILERSTFILSEKLMQRFKDLHMIIDLGSKCLKIGFSGESHPRSTFILNIGSALEIELTKLMKTIRKQIVISGDCKYAAICERVNLSRSFKAAFIYALFEEFTQFDSVTLYPSAALSLIPLATPNGLVIDIGNGQASVSPVFDKHVLYANHKSMYFDSKQNLQISSNTQLLELENEENLPRLILSCLSKVNLLIVSD